jgi:RHS repeat-associated protein
MGQKQCSDYQVFGMQMPGRNGSSSEYEYGFNGMLKDDEVKGEGNSLDFGARIYDSRIGRWLSRDPLASKYPSMSPYNFTGNNPILFTDSDGRVIVDPASGKPVEFINGEWKTVTVNTDGSRTYGGVSEDFNDKTRPTLETLQQSEIGKKLITQMQVHDSKITIDQTDEDGLLAKSSTSSNAVHKGKALTDDGLYTEVTVVPNVEEMLKNTKENGGSFEERLLGTMFVEFSHFETADQIEWEHSVSTYNNSRRFAQTYNDLMNNAISAMIDYRNENDITVDKSVFVIYEKFKEATNNEGKEIGTKIELSKENQEIYDSLED